MTDTILSVKDINVYYGSIHAIKGISFDVRQGEIVTLIGANGAGKSTTLNTISGLLRSRTGSITFCGEPIGKIPAYRLVSRGLAQVPEGRHVFLHMTVRENLELGAFTRYRHGAAARNKDLDAVYSLFPRLGERRGQMAGTLSGGEQQMLAMGRAMMSHPKLLMLDEPSMGLSPLFVDQVFEIIKDYHKSGTTILLVEQNAKKALSISDRAYVLETGAITAEGTAQDLLNNEEIVKAYLGG